jgi:hypothetical protein
MMMMTMMIVVIVMVTTKKKKKQPTVDGKGDDDSRRCDAAATVSKRWVSQERAKQKIRMKPTNEQIQARRGTPHTNAQPTCDGIGD